MRLRQPGAGADARRRAARKRAKFFAANRWVPRNLPRLRAAPVPRTKRNNGVARRHAKALRTMNPRDLRRAGMRGS